MITGGEKQPHKFWWQADKNSTAGLIQDRIKTIRADNERLRREAQVYIHLYEDQFRYSGHQGSKFAKAIRLGELLGARISKLNIMTSVVDTMISKIARNRPAIKIDADDANWGLRQRASNLSEVIRTKLDQFADESIQHDVFRDCLLTPVGHCRIYDDTGDITAEVVPYEEVFVDRRAARYGKPRELFHRREINRYVLASKFEKHKRAIMSAPAVVRNEYDEDETPADYDQAMVHVYDAWHLPTPDGKNGLWITTVEGAELQRVEWREPRFPIISCRYKKRRYGWEGTPLAAELFYLQSVIDKTLRSIINNLHYTSDLIIMSRQGSKVDVTKMGRMGKPYEVQYDGTPPDFTIPPPFNTQQFQFLEWLINKAYELVGINEMHAGGKNPLGANASGIALQEVWDQNSERLSPIELNFARFNKDLAEGVIDAGKRIAAREKDKESGEKSMIAWSQNNAFKRVEWDEVDMERDQYQLGLEPANFIPETRAGKLATIEELGKFGILPADALPELFNTPDLKMATKETQAPKNLARWVVGQIFKVVCIEGEGEDDEPTIDKEKSAKVPPPSPEMDLELTAALIKAHIQIAIADGAPDCVVDRANAAHTNYVAMIDDVKAKANQIAAADPMAGAAPPMDPAAAGAELAGPAPLPPGAAPEALPGEAMPGLGPPVPGVQ